MQRRSKLIAAGVVLINALWPVLISRYAQAAYSGTIKRSTCGSAANLTYGFSCQNSSCCSIQHTSCFDGDRALYPLMVDRTTAPAMAAMAAKVRVSGDSGTDKVCAILTTYTSAGVLSQESEACTSGSFAAQTIAPAALSLPSLGTADVYAYTNCGATGAAIHRVQAEYPVSAN